MMPDLSDVPAATEEQTKEWEAEQEAESPNYHVAIVLSVAGENLFRDMQANFGCEINGDTMPAIRNVIAGKAGAAPQSVTILSWQVID